MSKWKFLILLFVLIFVARTQESLVDNIRFMISETSSLSGATEDDLENITKKTKGFLKLCGPAGSLIAAGLNTVFDPMSDEQLAIMELNANMTKRFNELNQRPEQMENVLMSDAVEAEYGQSVTSKMNLLIEIFIMVTKPNMSRTGLKPLFKARCTYTAEPLSILETLNRLFRLECPVPTKNEIQQYAKVKDGFQRIYSRIKKELQNTKDKEDSKQLEAEILRRVNYKNEMEVKSLIDWLDTFYFETYSEINTKLKDESNFYVAPDGNKRCFLREILFSNDYKRDNLAAATRQLIFDLIRAEIFAVLCTNASTDGSASEIEGIIDTVENKAKAIGQHVIEWIKAAQTLSWPEVQVSAAKKDLGSDFIQIDQYEKSAKIIQNAFEARSERTSYNVIVSQKLDLDDYWSIRDLSSSVSTIDYNGINFFVLRYNLNQYERAVNATNWLANKTEPIRKLIDHAHHGESASAVLVLLNNKLGPLVSTELFHSVLLLRNRAFWYNSAQVFTGHANWTVSGASTAFQLYYRFDDFHATGWKLMFNI